VKVIDKLKFVGHSLRLCALAGNLAILSKLMTKVLDESAGEDQRHKPRIAASFYLNSAPLIWSFSRGSMRDHVKLLTDAAPARCADMLARGEADVALVPVIEFQRIPEISVVPNVCVGSSSRVRSVVLATRCKDLSDVRTIALDNSSRTSATLIQIIFREFLSIEPDCGPTVPDVAAMLEANDAALVIGDPAMTFSREGLFVHDLAGLWHEFTGLGFVFAMWMARDAAVDKTSKIDFAGARDEGIAAVDQIIDLYLDKLGLPREELREYLVENISFTMTPQMQSGLELYYKLAERHGFIDSAKPLKY
jgi:chorismate dehydratase